MIVDIFIPCYIDQMYPHTGNSMVKVLEKLGCSINYNVEQTCCGQPAFNAGYNDYCKEVSQKFITDFSNDRYIVSPSASCVGMIKNHYAEMFHNSVLHNEYKTIRIKTHEFTHFLIHILKATDTGAILDGKAVYMDSCSALHECGIRHEPRTLLEKVRGLQVVEAEDREACCGFGGMFSVKNSDLSVAMAEKKIGHILKTGAEYIISTDMTCLMHLDAYIKQQNIGLKVMHIADVLASGWNEYPS
jgi:L-lactate dehydrogenase complex protein LldE